MTDAREHDALDEALDHLATTNPQAAELVKLRYFAGLSNAEAAALLGISRAHYFRNWNFGRADSCAGLLFVAKVHRLVLSGAAGADQSIPG